MKIESAETITAKKYKAVLLADDTPESLTITGADVDGCPDDVEFVPGSMLITPGANYICFDEDGVFIEKGGA